MLGAVLILGAFAAVLAIEWAFPPPSLHAAGGGGPVVRSEMEQNQPKTDPDIVEVQGASAANAELTNELDGSWAWQADRAWEAQENASGLNMSDGAAAAETSGMVIDQDWAGLVDYRNAAHGRMSPVTMASGLGAVDEENTPDVPLARDGRFFSPWG